MKGRMPNEASPLTAEAGAGLVVGCGQAVAMATVTVNDLLDGHVVLDIECLDRIYLNGYVPNLQVGGQVVSFMTVIGATDPVAGDHGEDRDQVPSRGGGSPRPTDIPVVRFGKGDRKLDVMRPICVGRPPPAGPGSPRSGWRRSSRTCSPLPADRSRPVPWFPLLQGRPAGHLLLLLSVGHRVRSGVHQDLRLLPVSDQGLGQRPRVGQAAGRPGPGSGSLRCPTGSPPATTRPGCRRSVIGSVRAHRSVRRTLVAGCRCR